MADENEQVKVHVDDGTKRGHDRLMTRKDAEKFIQIDPRATILDAPAAPEEAPADPPAPPAEQTATRPRARRTSRATTAESPAPDDAGGDGESPPPDDAPRTDGSGA